MDNRKVENVNTVISVNQEAIPESQTNLKKRKSSKIFFRVALFMMRGRSKKSKVPPPAAADESRSIWRKLVGSMRPMHLQSNQSPPQINNEENEKMVITENSSNDNIHSEDGFDSATEFPNSPSPNLPSPTTSSRYASTVGLSEMVKSPSTGSAQYAFAAGLSEMVNSPSRGSAQYASTVGLSEMANSPSHVNSRYASAVGLSEMIEGEEKENEEEEEEQEQHEEEEEEKEEQEQHEEEEEVQQEKEEEKEQQEEEENENENEGNVVGDETIDAKADEFIAQFYQQMKLQRMNIVDRHYKKISNRSLGFYE